MQRGPLFQDKYKPQFSGHETFPLRYGWLKKVHDAVSDTDEGHDNRSIFQREEAIAQFGVGKNMVASMRHWATVCWMIEENQETGKLQPTELARIIFGCNGTQGFDPYLENPATLWLVHWLLCSQPLKTTWHWVFNHFPGNQFDRHQLVESLEKVAQDRKWGRVASATIKRDVECFVRTYVAHPVTGKHAQEDALESPLAELGLIKPIGRRDGFRLVTGSKPNLGNGVFLCALNMYWKNSNYKSLNQLPFDSIARAPGSPGRVFLLDENDLAGRLLEIHEVSDGLFHWSETSGIKGIIKNPNKRLSYKPYKYLKLDYS